MTDNMPDFDSMSPEEIMAWMETLAKRQGASEGFMTAADMDIAEIDPDTVVIDEPGYVPFGQEAPEKPQAAPTRAATPAPVEPPPPRPAVPPPTQPAPARATTSQPLQPAWARPVPPVPPRPSEPPPPRVTPVEPEQPLPQPAARREEPPAPQEQGSLAWLESLAADQDDSLFNLDLSGLAEEQPSEREPVATNPVTWLEDLARSQGEMPTTQTPAAPAPASGTDSMTWLESLARRQGANPEEFTTPANLDIPAPPEEVEEPAYTPFSFDTPTTHRTPPAPEPLKLDDPAAFLDSLATEQGYSEQGVRATQRPPEEPKPDMSIEGIQQAINEGTVTPEQMQVFLEHEAEFALQQPEAPLLDDFDPDAPPVPAELPDWLLEQVGPPPSAKAPQEETPAPEQDARLESVFTQPSALDDMPDWLKADVTSAEDVDLESIFAKTHEEPQAELSVPAIVRPEAQIEIDPNDPWAEAFDVEAEQGEVDVDVVPEWYQRNISDPQRIAAVERMSEEAEEQPDEVTAEAAEQVVPAPAAAGLSDEPLPEETDLPMGVLQDLPSWAPSFEPEPEPMPAQAFVSEAAEPQLAEEEPVTSNMPDWLRDLDTEVQVEPDEIPDWLKETLTPEEDVANIFTQPGPIVQGPEPEPFPVAPPAPSVPVQQPEPARPAPRPAPVSASLEAARASSQSGDLETSLAQYEALIRSSVELEAVVEDLSNMVRVHKGNPAVYRVLGDGLMRQGRLQAALDTYREALNQL